jgi:hypothetical protein
MLGGEAALEIRRLHRHGKRIREIARDALTSPTKLLECLGTSGMPSEEVPKMLGRATLLHGSAGLSVLGRMA